MKLSTILSIHSANQWATCIIDKKMQICFLWNNSGGRKSDIPAPSVVSFRTVASSIWVSLVSERSAFSLISRNRLVKDWGWLEWNKPSFSTSWSRSRVTACFVYYCLKVTFQTFNQSFLPLRFIELWQMWLIKQDDCSWDPTSSSAGRFNWTIMAMRE